MGLMTIFALGFVIWLYCKGIGFSESGSAATTASQAVQEIIVNDIHSQLNATRVSGVVKPASLETLQAAIRDAMLRRQVISISGGRHAMGGQQFGTHNLLLDMRAINQVLSFDQQKGRVVVEAGIEWPELMDYLVKNQEGQPKQWGIIQKQTGADRLTIGGSLSANVHGRGLTRKPIIDDVESFDLVDAKGDLKRCSRSENSELFRAAIGGYGLFGVIAKVELRLAPRTKLERIVKIIDIKDLMPSFEKRIKDGFLYGDFQYDTDESSDGFLRKGVFSCYQPVPDSALIPSKQKELTMEDWVRLYTLGHQDKKRAFESYSNYYLSTSGQVYWSDIHQLSLYPEGYHAGVDQRMGVKEPTSEMITEIYVPRDKLVDFMNQVRMDFLEKHVNVFYGTIRLIERDNESFLAWAKQPYACIIFNLHTAHDPQSLEKTAGDFRRLIDRAILYGGSYYLTYHRWATRPEVESCYPQFVEFLKLKKKYDPEERFQSDWYRHYRQMFGS